MCVCVFQKKRPNCLASSIRGGGRLRKDILCTHYISNGVPHYHYPAPYFMHTTPAAYKQPDQTELNGPGWPRMTPAGPPAGPPALAVAVAGRAGLVVLAIRLVESHFADQSNNSGGMHVCNGVCVLCLSVCNACDVCMYVMRALTLPFIERCNISTDDPLARPCSREGCYCLHSVSKRMFGLRSCRVTLPSLTTSVVVLRVVVVHICVCVYIYIYV